MIHTLRQHGAGSGPIAFGNKSDLFGWLHVPAARGNLPAVVICNPVGFELIRAHRSIRFLAEQLAASGHCVLRFDYRGTGDSAGDEFDTNRLADLLDSIHQATRTVTEIAGIQRVTLIGLRLGATLAAKIAEDTQLEQLVLWAPCESGALYVREQQIMASAQNKRLGQLEQFPECIDGVNAGGFFLSMDTQSELATLSIGAHRFKSSPPILLLNRDDIRIPPRLVKKLRENGATVDAALSPNYKEMMLPPQLSAVPETAINTICSWLAKQNCGDANKSENSHAGVAAAIWSHGNELRLAHGLREQAVRFGPADGLFGIVTTAATPTRAETPAVILLCGGATHRISANRMYVTLARRLAASGTTVMRVDLAGLGDSLPHEGYPANTPYSDKLVDDVEAAMSTVEGLTGAKKFLLFGLCSGAYAAMQTAKRSERVTDLVLVNQLVYFLSPADLENLATGAIASAHDLDFPRSNTLVYRSITKLLRCIAPYWGWPGERLSPYVIGGNLQRDLEMLATRGIRLAFVQSSRDDAVHALSITSGKWVRHLAESGLASITTFDGADHTFSPTTSQRALADWLEAYVGRLVKVQG